MIGLFYLLGKEGLGLLGEEWKIPLVNRSSHNWAPWLSPHQTLLPLRDAIPNTVPWDKLSARHRRGVKLVCQHPLGASLSACSILAAREMQVLQGEERKGLVILCVRGC